MKLGEKLLYLRKTKGLSQEQLAAQVTVSRQAISKWELGEAIPDTENVIQLTKLFNVSADFLLNDEIDIPIGVAANEEDTEDDGELSMLKGTLTDDEYKLAKKVIKDRQQRNKKFDWLGIAIPVFFVALIIIYFVFLR